jgi:hypothetical protein
MTWLSEHEATDLAFRRDSWIWIKAPLWVLLALFFYLESLWKAGTLLIASVVCSFTTPCFAGPDIGAGSLWIAFLFRLFVIAGVTHYVTYTLAFLSLPGWRNKALASLGIVLFWPLLMLVAVVGGLLLEKLGVPIFDVFRLEDRYVPVAAWRHTS